MADTNNDSEIIDEPTAVNPGGDVEMAESGVAEENGGADLPFAGEETVVEPEPSRIPFIDYLTSPIVTLIVGSGDNETVLTAHQALLTQSPFFRDECDRFTDDGSVSPIALRIAKLRRLSLHSCRPRRKARERIACQS